MQIQSKTSKVNRDFGWLVWAFLFFHFLGGLLAFVVIVWGWGGVWGFFCGSDVLLGAFFNALNFINNWGTWETWGSELNQVIVTLAAPIT